MTVFQGVFLGLLQGLTEFLPISSSGHLVLFQRLFGLNSSVSFDLLLHFGTLISILYVERKNILMLFQKPFGKMLRLIVATLPAVVVILLFRSSIEGLFSSNILPFGFLFTAIVLTLCEIVSKSIKGKTPNLTYKSAFVMGVFQSIAVIPAVSRSGMTISAGVILCDDKKLVADFAFLMSVPIILGSMVVTIFEGGLNSLEVMPSIFGVVASIISSFLAIKLMLKLVRKVSFVWFSIYLTILAVITFVVL